MLPVLSWDAVILEVRMLPILAWPYCTTPSYDMETFFSFSRSQVFLCAVLVMNSHFKAEKTVPPKTLWFSTCWMSWLDHDTSFLKAFSSDLLMQINSLENAVIFSPSCLLFCQIVQEPIQFTDNVSCVSPVRNHNSVRQKKELYCICDADISATCQLGWAASGKPAVISYNQDKTELCTEHAQRTQLWHLSGEQSSYCVPL